MKALLVPCLAFLASLAASAQERGPDSGQSMLLGIDVHRFDYKENVPAPLKSTETGTIPQVRGEYRHEPATSPWYVALALDLASASTTFDGTTQTGKPVTSTTTNIFADFEGDVGFPFVGGESLRLLGVGGLGYRYWQRGNGATNSAGVVDYEEDYHWFFAPVGLRLETSPSDSLRLALEVVALFPFASGITVHLDQIDPSLSNASASLGSKVGYRARLAAELAISRGYSLQLAPWYESTAIGHSPTFPITQDGKQIGSGQEPDSRTYRYGASLLAVFPLQ